MRKKNKREYHVFFFFVFNGSISWKTILLLGIFFKIDIKKKNNRGSPLYSFFFL